MDKGLVKIKLTIKGEGFRKCLLIIAAHSLIRSVSVGEPLRALIPNFHIWKMNEEIQRIPKVLSIPQFSKFEPSKCVNIIYPDFCKTPEVRDKAQTS